MSENACAPSNREKMEAAVDGWCESARTHPNGKALAEARAEWLEDQLAALVNEPAPKHLIGLNAFDLANARDRMSAVVVELG